MTNPFCLFTFPIAVLLLIHHFMGNSLHTWAVGGGIAKAGCYIFTIGLCLLAADAAARLDALLPRKSY